MMNTNVELMFTAMVFLGTLYYSWHLVPDVVRYLRRRPLRDPVSFWAIARYTADLGDHCKHKPQILWPILLGVFLSFMTILFGCVVVVGAVKLFKT